MDFRDPGEKSILTEVHLIGGSARWAGSMDFDRPTALSDSLYQANNELKPVIRFDHELGTRLTTKLCIELKTIEI